MSKFMFLTEIALPAKSGYYIVRMPQNADLVAHTLGLMEHERWFDAQARTWPNCGFEPEAWRVMTERDKDARDDDSL